jgi:hypothetical protein
MDGPSLGRRGTHQTSIYRHQAFSSAAALVKFHGSILYVSTLPWPRHTKSQADQKRVLTHDSGAIFQDSRTREARDLTTWKSRVASTCIAEPKSCTRRCRV